MAFVQKANATGTTTASLTLAGVGAGNCISVVAQVGSNFAPTIHSVADGQGSYTAQGSPVTDSSNNIWIQVFTLQNANAGSHAVVFTSDSGASVEIEVVESTAPTTGAVVGTVGQEQNSVGTTTDALTSTIITIGVNATLYGWSADTSNVGVGFEPAAGTGFTSRDNNADSVVGSWRLESKSVSANAAATFTALAPGTSRYLTIGWTIAEPTAAADQPPSQISYPEDMGVYEATDDPAPFEFYTDTTANRADVQPPIPVELPQSYEWEDVNNADEALWQWPLSQAPPIPDFVPDYIRPQDGSEQLEDFDEDFGFADVPAPADVVVVVDQIQPYDADEQFEEPDEDFGFIDAQVPDDIVDQLFNNFDGYFGEEDEFEGFADTPQDTGAAAPVDMPFTEDSDGQLEADDEPFGFSDAPLQEDDQGAIELGNDQADDEQLEGFSLGPTPEDAPMLAIVEDAEQEEEDEFAEGFADAPLSDDAAVDQVVVEDGTFQPPDPEDEDFATFDAPLADDVFDLNIVWPETGDNQIDTPDDEDFSFSLGPTPDDVIPPPPTNPTVDDGGWNFGHVGLGPFVRKIFATRVPLASREAVQIVGAQAELPLRHDAQAPAVFAEREHDAHSLKPIVLQLMRTTYLPLSGGST